MDLYKYIQNLIININGYTILPFISYGIGNLDLASGGYISGLKTQGNQIINLGINTNSNNKYWIASVKTILRMMAN